MKGLIQRISVVVLLLVFVSACFQPPPPSPEVTPKLPEAEETPLLNDTNIDQATDDLGDAEIDGATDDLGNADSLEGEVDDSAGVNLDAETATESPSTDLTAQAVLPGGKGFVVYVWNSSNSATSPWRIYRHNAATDVTTLVYGGLRQISSVAVSGDGNTLLVSMKETTDPASDFEIYQIALSPLSVTQLTSNTGEDTNVSMSGNGSFYVWEGDSANAGLRNVFLRTNTATPATTTALAPTLNSTQPSITNDGRFIALVRRSTTNAYQIFVYNRTTNVYTLRVSSGSVIEHPSVSNYAEKVAWLMKVSATSNRIYTRDLLAPSTTPSVIVINTSSVLDHPHLSADGNYLSYAQQVSGRFVVYNRNLTTNQQVLPVSTTASLTAPYWQLSTPTTATIGANGGEIIVQSGAIHRALTHQDWNVSTILQTPLPDIHL
jgi:Tol biopolymer transport system component